MELVSFVQSLSLKGIQLSLKEDGNLRIGGSKATLNSTIIESLKQRKVEIIKLLHNCPDIFDVHPLSYGQKGLWFLWQLNPDSAAYHMAFACRIYSPLQIDSWYEACQILCDRHPNLRSTFPQRESGPVQWVHQTFKADFQWIDASSWQESELHDNVIEQYKTPFNLEQNSPMRVRVFTQNEEKHILLLTIHHIAGDGWSIELVVNELLSLYAAISTGQTPSLPPVDRTYQDYVQWQQNLLISPQGEKLRSYWQQQLAGQLPILQLPADRPRPSFQTYNGASQFCQLPNSLVAKLKTLATTERTTLYVVLLTAFQILLYRYTGQDDILIGSPLAAGRSQSQFTAVIGNFIDQVVLRGKLVGNPTCRELLAQNRRTVLEMFANQGYPFPLLVEELQVQPNPSYHPIFQVAFILQNFRQSPVMEALLSPKAVQEPITWHNLQLAPLEMPQQEGQFDLTLEAVETSEAVYTVFKYNADLFNADRIERMMGHLQTLLEGIVTNPESAIATLPLLTNTEQQQLLVDWNQTSIDYPQHLCIHQWFEQQVEQTPEAIAVIFGNQTLTYRALNEKSNQLAHYLQSLGVQPETLVGICVERSLEMAIGLLGILKAGGAYVPLDPTYPQERLAYMLSDANISVLLTQQRLLAILPVISAQIITLDADIRQLPPKLENPQTEVKSHHLAYVIYTSGSTGQPKGVMVEHRQVANFFVGMDERIVGNGGVWLALTTISFDISILEIFWTLARGFQVILQDDPKNLSPTKISSLTKPNTKPLEFSLFYFASDNQALEGTGNTGQGTGNREQGTGNREQGMGNGEQGVGEVLDRDLNLGKYNPPKETKLLNPHCSPFPVPRSLEQYKLLIEGAKFADRNGFTAVWIPERHFHAFGGIYPNPAVAAAAIATITEQVQIRAGSVVLPLHSELRIAEEWALVDNLSNGRVGISFASGWQPNDFVLAPDHYAERKTIMAQGIATVRQLWRGEAIALLDGTGQTIDVQTFPRPVQPELPVWVTAAGNPETFRLAGELGANVLTHLLGQSLEELAAKIKLYRQVWQEQGYAGTGHITLMLHTFIGEDLETVREQVRRPLCNYLNSSMDLVLKMWDGTDLAAQVKSWDEGDREALLSFAFNRYFETSGLLGTPEKCLSLIERLQAIGVDEVACLIDFGMDVDSTLSSLNYLKEVKERSNLGTSNHDPEHSVLAQLQKYPVSHLQCTPSWLRMLMTTHSLHPLRSLQALMVGGESLSPSLVQQLKEAIPGKIYNMYGPTEATIWSTTHTIDVSDRKIPIGQAIANTQIYILDRYLQPVPIGVPGELHIGGAGLARGYLHRTDITQAKFISNPFSTEPKARIYKTGDLAQYLPDGSIEFLGRIDNQVKVRGFRIELGEIETVLNQHPQIRESCVIVLKGNGEQATGNRVDEDTVAFEQQRLVAYFISHQQPHSGQKLLKLPNGMTINHLSAHQTNALYAEIFENQIYLKHGITLNDGDCVFDVGANIGLFTLFVQQNFSNTTVYAFEPIPPTFNILQANLSQYSPQVKLLEYGLSHQQETVKFTFYPEMSGISGRFAEPEKDKRAAKAMIIHQVENGVVGRQGIRSQEGIDEFLAERYRSETYLCQLKTLSTIIREYKIEQIDLLKIDVEKSEYLVIEGIEEQDWPKIKQLAIEVDGLENLQKITTLLEEKNYQVSVDEYIISKGEQPDSNIEVYMLYAIHPNRSIRKSRETKSQRKQHLEQLSGQNFLSVSTSELRQFLKAKLPEYMIPNDFVQLSAFPLTPNGKIDRQALPLPDFQNQRTQEFVAPQTDTEQAIADIFAAVLGVEAVGITDNFFELGGHSFLATQAIAQIQDTFNIEIPLRALFEANTVADLAIIVEEILLKQIEELTEEEAEALVK
ncbi:MupA/Atu3671 family FMN-dependent luciferase-like monooxygenase, partial [uncultured Nostoc sp.]|uniref:MupA/Atu3671 family FMN-dependent luciferase-like monooxygenase n=1 Tax=uncultured Nostoc sp. TaxID=340711 RepID=UPI0035CB2F1B